MALIENAIVWIVDFFKVRNPKVFAILTVALVALLGVLNEVVDRGVVCTNWQETVQADIFATVSPGDSVVLDSFIVQDTIPGTWINSPEGVFLADKAGVGLWVYEKDNGETITVATNTCFISDTTGVLAKILFWLTTIVTALVGVHTSDRKRQLVAKKGK